MTSVEQFFHEGLGLTEVALGLQRVGLGTFFALSGYHKLTNKARHQRLVATLVKDKVPGVWFNQWWVPAWEFVGGFSLAIGFLPAFSATVLLVICVVACMAEAHARVMEYQPVDFADEVDDYLYLPEVLYVIMLGTVILGGGGRLF